MIPRCMSFFWAGTPMSWLRYLSIRSFRAYNLGWEIRLYEPPRPCMPARRKFSEYDDRDYSGPDYREQLAGLGVGRRTWRPPLPGELSPAHASDLFQWELLSGDGGWYSDMDVLYLRPVPDDWSQGDAVFCLEGGGMAIGFMGAAPGCRVFADVMAQSCEHLRPGAYQCTGVEAVYRAAGVWPLARNSSGNGVKAVEGFRRLWPALRINTVPDSSIYYYDWISYVRLFDYDERVPPECVGLHWFGGSAISQRWNCTLSPQNVQQHSNTLAHYAREVTRA